MARFDRFALPTDSDDIVQCDKCEHKAHHEAMYWDDIRLVYLCEEHKPEKDEE